MCEEIKAIGLQFIPHSIAGVYSWEKKEGKKPDQYPCKQVDHLIYQ